VGLVREREQSVKRPISFDACIWILLGALALIVVFWHPKPAPLPPERVQRTGHHHGR
jgi:hypothetical protein